MSFIWFVYSVLVSSYIHRTTGSPTFYINRLLRSAKGTLINKQLPQLSICLCYKSEFGLFVLYQTVRTSLETNASATRPSSIRTSVEQASRPASILGIRPSSSSESLDQQPLSARSTTPIRTSLGSAEQQQHSSSAKLTFQSKNTSEQPPSARTPTTPLAGNQLSSSVPEQPLSARSLAANRSGNFGGKPIPSSVPLSLRTAAAEAQPEARKDKR